MFVRSFFKSRRCSLRANFTLWSLFGLKNGGGESSPFAFLTSSQNVRSFYSQNRWGREQQIKGACKRWGSSPLPPRQITSMVARRFISFVCLQVIQPLLLRLPTSGGGGQCYREERNKSLIWGGGTCGKGSLNVPRKEG